MIVDVIAVFIATIIYLSVVLAVGVFCFRKVHTLNEFCIGARARCSAELGLSGQLSELGFFIFVTIPAGIYLYGLGKAWVMAGLFIGTMFIWYLMSFRMMRYSLKYQNVYTLPDYFERRFGKGDALPLSAAVINILFDLIMSSALIVFLSEIVSDIFEIKPIITSVSCVVVVMLLICLSGFVGAVKIDRINAIVVLAALLAMPVVTLFIFEADDLIVSIMNSRVVGGVSRYLDLLRVNGKSIKPLEIVNQLSWGFVIMGLPGLMVRFLAIGKARTAKHGGRYAILFTLLALFFTVVCGVLYRAFLYPMILKGGNDHLIIAKTVKKLTEMKLGYKIAGGLIFVGFLASIISMLISEIHNACAVIYCSIIRPRVMKKKKIRKNLMALRITLVVVSLIVFALTTVDIDPVIIIETALICVGSAFGPCTMLSLYYRRMNKYGATTGMLSGVIVALLWRFLEVFKASGEITDLEDMTGVSPILPAFVISTLLILVVSRLTPDVSEAIKKDHDDVKNRIL